MDSNALIVIAVLVVALVLAAIWTLRRRRHVELRRRFGPEYDEVVRRHADNPRAAERELGERERRVAKLEIHPLMREDAARFNDRWRTTQARFVDDPGGAVAEADQLVMEVMRTRGYPMTDFEQRAADVSVDHSHVVGNYRAAHAIAERHAHGAASTEELRQALVHYRELFADVLEVEEVKRKAAGGGR